MTTPIRVMIVDDHPMVRQGLRTFLDLNDAIEVVGEAGNGLEGVQHAVTLQPDVVLMDLVMPGCNGVEATRSLKQQAPHIKVLILTSFIEDDKVYPALEAGASSYMLKDVSPDQLVKAIQATHRGEAQLHPKVTQKLMSQVVQQRQPKVTPQGPEELTQRELEVLQHIAEGLNNQAIAKALFISQKTVKTHVSHILAKLDLDDRTQAAIYAIKHGLTRA